MGTFGGHRAPKCKGCGVRNGSSRWHFENEEGEIQIALLCPDCAIKRDAWAYAIGRWSAAQLRKEGLLERPRFYARFPDTQEGKAANMAAERERQQKAAQEKEAKALAAAPPTSTTVEEPQAYFLDTGAIYLYWCLKHANEKEEGAELRPISRTAPTATCQQCQAPIHPCPFEYRQIVEVRGQRYREQYTGGCRYILVLGIHWYWNQWVIDLAQKLGEYGDDGEAMLVACTPVKVYMVPADICQATTGMKLAIGKLVSAAPNY